MADNTQPSAAPSGGASVTGDAQNPSSLSSPQIPPSPQISSPQSQSLNPNPNSLDYASKPHQHLQAQQLQQNHQQPLANSASGSFQIQQNVNRPGSIPRLSQIQQQFGAQAAASAMRQHAGMYGGGQVNFGGGQVQTQSQSQQLAAAAAGMSRSGMMMQAGQLQMLPGQTAQHFNLQSQVRQKNLIQGAQFHATNSSGQALQGMQQMGVMNTAGLNQQLRANGQLQYSQQRFPQGQLRLQQMAQQAALTSSQKVSSQNLQRASSVAATNQITGLAQNGQTLLMQNTLAPQPWLKNLQPSVPSPVSPSYLSAQQRQQQAILQHHLNSGQLQKSMPLTQQQISQLLLQQQQQQQQPQLGTQQQQQPQLGTQQQQQQQQQHLLQQQQFQQMQQQMQQQHHLHQQQLQSPRLLGSAAQKSLSLTGSQPETPASGTAMTGGSSSQGAEAANQLLGKRKIHDLVSQVDPLGRLDPDVEDFLLEIADDFIDSVTSFACNLAKHRKSSTLEAKDVLLHLEKNWHLTVPGFTREENNHQRKSNPADAHMQRLNIVRELVESQLSERDLDAAKGLNKQVSEAGADRLTKPSSSSEHLSLPTVSSQMLQRVHRF